MAQAISNKALVRNNKYCWMICDYTMSGDVMNYTLSFYFEGGDAQLDNAWIKVGGNTVWSNPGRVMNYTGQDSRGVYTFTIHSGSTYISGAQTVSFGITKYSGVQLSGAFTTSAMTPPSGLHCILNSVAWNSVNGTFSVDNWGGSAPDYIAGRLFGATGDARREESSYGQSSITRSITTNSAALDGGIEVKGAGVYRMDTFASNGAGINITQKIDVFTPPAPLQPFVITQTPRAEDVLITVVIKGGTSSNNYSSTVSTYWRYSTDGGSTYSGWEQLVTGLPWEERTVTFTGPYNANVIVQAYQSFRNLSSETRSESFSAASGAAPSGYAVSVTNKTWNSITVAGSIDSYGEPEGMSGRRIVLGASTGDTTESPGLENYFPAVLAGEGTVTNSSSPWASGFTLKGMLEVYPYIRATNGVKWGALFGAAEQLPPAPGILSFSFDNVDEYQVSYVGSTANNISDYDASELTRTVRYKISGGDWVYIDNESTLPLDTVTSFSATVPYGSTITVEAWMEYRGERSELSTFSVTNGVISRHFYGSVDNKAEAIEHFYGSVNYRSVKIIKIYGSVGGTARGIFEDV